MLPDLRWTKCVFHIVIKMCFVIASFINLSFLVGCVSCAKQMTVDCEP